MEPEIQQIAELFKSGNYELGRQLCKAANVNIALVADYMLEELGVFKTFEESRYVCKHRRVLRWLLSGDTILYDNSINRTPRNKNYYDVVNFIYKFKSTPVFNTLLRSYPSGKHYGRTTPVFEFRMNLIGGFDSSLGIATDAAINLWFQENEIIKEHVFNKRYRGFRQKILNSYVEVLEYKKDD